MWMDLANAQRGWDVPYPTPVYWGGPGDVSDVSHHSAGAAGRGLKGREKFNEI